jgi:hypothetical protein
MKRLRVKPRAAICPIRTQNPDGPFTTTVERKLSGLSFYLFSLVQHTTVWLQWSMLETKITRSHIWVFLSYKVSVEVDGLHTTLETCLQSPVPPVTPSFLLHCANCVLVVKCLASWNFLTCYLAPMLLHIYFTLVPSLKRHGFKCSSIALPLCLADPSCRGITCRR